MNFQDKELQDDEAKQNISKLTDMIKDLKK